MRFGVVQFASMFFRVLRAEQEGVVVLVNGTRKNSGVIRLSLMGINKGGSKFCAERISNKEICEGGQVTTAFS